MQQHLNCRYYCVSSCWTVPPSNVPWASFCRFPFFFFFIWAFFSFLGFSPSALGGPFFCFGSDFALGPATLGTLAGPPTPQFFFCLFGFTAHKGPFWLFDFWAVFFLRDSGPYGVVLGLWLTTVFFSLRIYYFSLLSLLGLSFCTSWAPAD